MPIEIGKIENIVKEEELIGGEKKIRTIIIKKVSKESITPIDKSLN